MAIGRSKRIAHTKAPLRISFVGGGSDLCKIEVGHTVSAAIDKYVHVFMNRRQDNQVIVNWRHREEVSHTRDLQHELIRECLLKEGICSGIEITTFADVPGVGSGLASSSATTAATLGAIYALKGYDLTEWETREFLAQQVCDVELNRLGRSGGQQDQYTVALGGFLYLMHKDKRVMQKTALQVDDYAMKRMSEHFMLFKANKGKGRDSESILRDFCEPPGFGRSCETLCNEFLSLVDKRDYHLLGNLVSRHRTLKEKAFSKYMEESEVEAIKDKAGWNWKLCGAGSTGHVLVATTPETCEQDRIKFVEAWGPEVPFDFIRTGTEIISCE